MEPTDALKPEKLAIQLEFLPEEELNPILLGEISRDFTANLRNARYQVDPVYTAQKGGGLFEVFVELAQNAWQNKETLVALLTPATPILQYLLKKKQERATGKNQTVEIELELDNLLIPVAGDDADTPEKLAAKVTAIQPTVAKSANPVSKIKINVKVPKS